jgi:hypothetical protein
MQVALNNPKVSHPDVIPSPCVAFTMRFTLDCSPEQAAFIRAVFLKGIPTKRLILDSLETDQADLFYHMVEYLVKATTVLQTIPANSSYVIDYHNTTESLGQATYLGSGLEPFVFAQTSLATIRPSKRFQAKVTVVEQTGDGDANFNSAYIVGFMAEDFDPKQLSFQQTPKKHTFTVKNNGDRSPETLVQEFTEQALRSLDRLEEGQFISANTGPAGSITLSYAQMAYSKDHHFYQTINMVKELILEQYPALTVCNTSEKTEGAYHLCLSIRDESEFRRALNAGIAKAKALVNTWKIRRRA